ncbi:hypothetical protein [Paenibacillus xylanexedens]|uniref:hypothetical protein n=1 Tax=Paenibacillus xylanexedens TaxID=528191 RepID=UPI0011A1CFB7|nr:hypothetical protein [Paenibacillus xylanexedens]
MTATMENEYEAGIAIPPGETILEAMLARGIPAGAFGDDPQEAVDILRGMYPITSEYAQKFADLTDLPVDFIMNLERDYVETLKRLGEERPK